MGRRLLPLLVAEPEGGGIVAEALRQRHSRQHRLVRPRHPERLPECQGNVGIALHAGAEGKQNGGGKQEDREHERIPED